MKEQNKYAEVFELIAKITKKTQGKACVFRGESMLFPEVSSKLWRFRDIKKFNRDLHDLEKQIYDDVKKHFTDNQSMLSALAELQHLGGHTNLIDFTENMFIALYFACDTKEHRGDPGRLIICKKPDESTERTELEERIENAKRTERTNLIIIKDNEVFEAYHEVKNDQPVLVYSTNKHNRIVAQHGLFIHTKTGVLDIKDEKLFVEPIIINSEIKQKLQNFLEVYLNIDDDTVYNDINGFLKFFESKYSSSKGGSNNDPTPGGSTDNEPIPFTPSAETEEKKVKSASSEIETLIETLFKDGVDYFSSGEYDKAFKRFNEALEIIKDKLGEDHVNTANSYNNLATTLFAQGKYKDAEPYYEKALEIRRRTLGEDHFNTANSYNNLAFNLNAQGKYKDAEFLLRKALKICQRKLGENHRDTATSYNNLAANSDEQGKYKDAERSHRKALEIRKRTLGEDHQDTANSYNNLAFNLNAQGKYTDAEPYYEKGLEICRRIFGEAHPDTADSYHNLASNLNAQYKYEDAEPYYEKALEIRKRTLGEDHPKTATSYYNFAYNLHSQDKFEEAKPYYEKALEICQRTLGKDHPDTKQIQQNYAQLLAKMKP